MLSPDSYRQQLKAMARSLRQEGLSQTAIARELGVPRQTITRWLNMKQQPDQIAQNEQTMSNAQNGLSTPTAPRYLVVQGSVEKFRPPEGVMFPLIIADPPWNVSDPGHKRDRKVRPRPFTKDFGTWDRFSGDRAYLAKCRQWLKALFDVAAPDSWLFFWCSYQYISYILAQAASVGWVKTTFYVWGKTNPMPMFGNNNFVQSVELALVLAKGSPQFRFKKKGQPHNRFESPQVGGSERVKRHDGSAANLAQKPSALLSLWIGWASKPGDWVLDAFAGTGATTVAALQLNRNACAVELDPKLIPYIEGRVQEECKGAVAFQG